MVNFDAMKKENAIGADENGDTVQSDVRPAIPNPANVRVWTTKGIHFWALLSAVLVKARPTSMLEFGSGRSTTFLADYAYRQRAPFVAIEQSRVWHRKVSSDLQFMAVKSEYVHHVPIVEQDDDLAWYDPKMSAQLIDDKAFDLVFVDGPVGDARNSKAGRALIAEAARDARMIFVDDVHRPYNNAFFLELTEKFPIDGIFYYKYGKNLIAIGVTHELSAMVRTAFEFLELKHTNVAP